MNRRRISVAESNESDIVNGNDYSDGVSQSHEDLSLEDQQRLVGILDQYMIDVEEGRTVATSKLLIDNADIASSIQHYLGGIQIAKDVRGADSTSPQFGHLGDYLLGPIIGQGAMGIVYKARDIVGERDVAVKVLAHATALDQTHIDRFRLEAKAAASLDHPNVVPVYSVGFDQGTHYYAMQLIDGQSLDRRIAAAQTPRSSKNVVLGTAPVAQSAAPLIGPDRYRRISQIGVSAANALHSAHVAGIIHRDVKPSNLMLGNDGQL